MNNRNLFMIVDNSVKILPNTTMDHREWYTQLGLDLNNFENIIRGYVIDNKIVFFKGSTFTYDDETYKAALVYSPVIRNYFNNPNLEVCCGIIISQYDSKWEPVVRISNDEITNYKPLPQPVEKKYYSKVETAPVIEFKNNYEDKKFIMTATVVTSIVLVLVIIIKIILFKEQKILQLSNPLDILLSITQIGLLVFCIFGYLKKLSFTKYISIIASVFMVLTLDIYDIIIGILYFLFSIDQSYFTKLINIVKKGK